MINSYHIGCHSRLSGTLPEHSAFLKSFYKKDISYSKNWFNTEIMLTLLNFLMLFLLTAINAFLSHSITDRNFSSTKPVTSITFHRNTEERQKCCENVPKQLGKWAKWRALSTPVSSRKYGLRETRRDYKVAINR